MSVKNHDRRKMIFKMRSEGKTMQEIANVFGISRQRVHQVLSTGEAKTLNNTIDKKKARA